MELHIAAVTQDQVGQLSHISYTTFATAFESQNNPTDFAQYTNSRFTEEQLCKELKNPNSEFYFVRRSDDLVGYFKLNQGLAQTELQGAGAMEVERIYVSENYQGNGIGKWILRKVIEMARERKKSFIWLGVWEHNTPAIRFYERYGFQKFGEHPYYVGSDRQMDWLMRLDLVTLNS